MIRPQYYLAGDIGGTKSWMALVSRPSGTSWQSIERKKYLNSQFESLQHLIESCLVEWGVSVDEVAGVSFAVAGPVSKGYSALTNLDWQIDTGQLKKAFDLCHASLINDFYAAALGIRLINDEDLLHLNHCQPMKGGVRVVTGAGTGLGLAWVASGVIHATEGGHTGFSPADVEQRQLVAYLAERAGNLTWESVLSGSGLSKLYHFCKASTLYDGTDPSEITRLATAGDASALHAIELFWRIFANWIGDLALLFRPEAGIYLTGGVTNRLLPWLNKESFIEACYNQGVMRLLVETTPISVVINEQLGLLGAIANLENIKGS